MNSRRFTCIFLLPVLFAGCFLFHPAVDYEILDMSFQPWQFREAGKGKWFPAGIPGSVYLDLQRNDLIQNPFYRNNEKKYKSIGEKNWEYRTFFNVDKKFLEKFERIELVFEGLDTYAKVYLNEKLILEADNFFRSWIIPCRKKLKVGQNVLRLVFVSPLKINRKKTLNYPYRKPIAEYVFSRKPAYHFGWDWAPALVPQGIWKPVYLRAWRQAWLEDMQIYQKKVDKKRALLTFSFEILATGQQKATLLLHSHKLKKKLKKRVLLSKGVNLVKMEVEVQNPRLWWTHDLGKPFLYDFTGELLIGKKIKGVRRENIGIRRLRVVQERDSYGKSFYIELNGVALFARGANYVPQDVFPSRPCIENYVKLIKSAVAANMNMLRVWGGGFYEREIFYDLCDEYGILVWQDFPFACAMYPGDEDFFKNVEREAVENVKRLRNHPSLALWCGNNEIKEGWENWGWQKAYTPQERESLWKDYERLFHQLLPRIVRKYDPGRFYWPSSPFHGWAEKQKNEGDVHFWGVWHGQMPFEAFEERKNIARFVSEYGFQALPSFETVKKFTLPEDRRVNSEVMKIHQKHPAGYQIIEKFMKRYYGIVPKDLETYIYLSQLLQAEGIKRAVEAHRRARPFCMGTLYWQLNDCWPAVSWSSIDYYGRWKALHYFIHKAFSPVLISPIVEKGLLRVYVINDLPNRFSAKMQLQLLDFEGKILWNQIIPVEILPLSSAIKFEKSVGEVLKGSDRTKTVLYVALKREEELLSENLLYFTAAKELSLKKPYVKYEIKKEGEGFTISLSSKNLAKNLYLSYAGEGCFSDNFFDLLPGKIRKIKLLTEESPERVKSRIKFMSLWDCLNSFKEDENN